MSDIFVSYASEDRERARTLALALEQRGWSVWWDREIPLGRSYDEVIERALDGASCMLVLWSAASAASEWVRSEASEGRRRGILVPVFLEEVEAPLAFRLLNGAQLANWDPSQPDAEFDRLTERVAEILAQPPTGSAKRPAAPARREATALRDDYAPPPLPALWKSAWVLGGAVATAVLLLIGGYFWLRPAPPPLVSSTVPAPELPAPVNPAAPGPATAGPGHEFSDLAAALKPLAQGLGSSGNLALRAFKIPGLGLDIAYIGPEQAQATGGTLPTGAVVWVVSDGPAQRAGLQILDVVAAIDGQPVRNDNDLRRLIGELGPGKHKMRILRSGTARTVELNCPACVASHKPALAAKPKPKTLASAAQPGKTVPAPSATAASPAPARHATSRPEEPAPSPPRTETPAPPARPSVAAQRPVVVLAALGLPISRSFWSGESSATYTRKMQGVLQKASREVLRMTPRSLELSKSEFNAWWNESRDHARSNARCAEPDAPKALLSARMETPTTMSTVESAYWPELQLRLWVCGRQMGNRQVKVLTPHRDDEWPFSVELGAETERFLREHRADIAD